jgi:glucokinase
VTVALGLDVGGTNIGVCLFDVHTCAVVDSARLSTDAARGGAAVLASCAAATNEMASAHGVGNDVPVGVAVCELVDLDGAVTSAATFDWRHVGVAEGFAGHPTVVVESDVRAAAVAEARLGAGRGFGNFVYLSVGTGIAFALVIDGSTYRGARGNAVILGAPPVEGTASGKALASAARTTAAFQQGASDLGVAMAWLVNALDPQIFVVGGGLGLDDEYRNAAVEAMRPLIEADSARCLPVVPASLGHLAGAVGAALLAADRHRAATGKD